MKGPLEASHPAANGLLIGGKLQAEACNTLLVPLIDYGHGSRP
jgi:hypothetical protein